MPKCIHEIVAAAKKGYKPTSSKMNPNPNCIQQDNGGWVTICAEGKKIRIYIGVRGSNKGKYLKYILSRMSGGERWEGVLRISRRIRIKY
jgi:hypothetical protein